MRLTSLPLLQWLEYDELKSEVHNDMDLDTTVAQENVVWFKFCIFCNL